MEPLKELLGHPIELYNLMKFKISGSAGFKVDQDSLSDNLCVCYKYLNETGRSFGIVIPMLDEELRHAVCIFYLVQRALDTVEDDMTISLEKKVFMLQNFHSYLYQPDWKFMGSKGKDKQLLENFPTISLEFRKLAKVFQEVIVDTCHKTGHGLAEFLQKKVDSVKDWEEYCHYAFGLLGIGFCQLLSATNLEESIVDQDLNLANSMGHFLQKTNIIRDYLEDQQEGREFWPKEVWSKYAKKLSDLAKPKNANKAVQCMNELIANALQHVPDMLTFLSRLKNQSVFSFCALPQVMAIATLAACYNNQQVFRGAVKIRKGQIVTLMMKATNLQAVKAIMHQYMEEIYQKMPSTDPSSHKIQEIVSSLQSISKLSNGFAPQTSSIPFFFSCVMLVVAFWWLSTV